VPSNSTQTNYDVSIDLESEGGQATTHFLIPRELGLSDAQVLDFIKYLRAYRWPTGITSAFTVNKWDQTTVAYITDLASDPPAFI